MGKVLTFICLLFLILSCSESPTVKKEATKAQKTKEVKTIEAKTKEKIKGGWSEMKKDSVKNENKKWVFNDSSVDWGEYTQEYEVKGDTIYIAGIPHVIIEEAKETIVLYSPRTKTRTALKKEASHY